MPMSSSTFTKTLSLMAYENSLTPETPDDYILRVKTQPRSLDVSDIAREVARRLGKYQEDEIGLITNNVCEVVADAVASGYMVNLPLCHIQPTVSGVVMKNELSLAPDHKKVKVGTTFSAGAQMREAIKNAKLELFVQPAPVGPLLNGGINTRTVVDDKGAATRAPLMAGDMCVLTGSKIKLAGTDPSVGILLTSVDTPSKTYFISPDYVYPNEPKRLQFVLPADMAEGDWMVKVTTQYGSGHTLVAKPRSCVLDTPITIGETGGGVEDPTA